MLKTPAYLAWQKNDRIRMRLTYHNLVVTSLLTMVVFCSATGKVKAFHQGGAGECEGCHTMHNSYEGMPVTATSPAGSAGAYLLKGSDPSSVCLNCHQKSGDTGPASFHVSTADTDMPTGSPPLQLPPGGDFGWLKKNYTWIPALGAMPLTSPGDSHGHNIVAQDYGYFADSYKTTAPGGFYPAMNLGCTSCHDPHGKYRRFADGSIGTTNTPIKDSGSLSGSPDPDQQQSVGVYRLLGGVGYIPKSMGGGFAFSYNPPAAVAPDNYNRSESLTQTRVVYGAGMSDWCRNCHANIHTDAVPATLKHPAGSPNGSLSAEIRNYYDQYIKDGNLTGMESNAWLSLVPFEAGTTNYATLKSLVTTNPAKGPSITDGTPAVMCLTCHRAHASGWDGSMRWNNRTVNIVLNGLYTGGQAGQAFQPNAQGKTELEALRAYYDIPVSTFASPQKALCYKCHVNGTE
jgi:hypothetical protein